MIDRYTTPEMKEVFSSKKKYAIWLLVEKEVARAEEELGIIPKGLYQCLSKVKEIDPAEIEKYERETHHEVTAFLKAVWNHAPCAKNYLHFGLTSQDIIDTSTALIVKEAYEILTEELRNFRMLLKKLSLQYKDVIIMGRTHGQAAAPLSLGLRFLSWYEEGKRVEERLENAIKDFMYGKLSGTVGSFNLIPPEVEKKVMEKLGLKPEPVATQVIPRDRYANLLFALCMLSCWIERIAFNIRLMQQEGIEEAYEPFSKKQTGSSAMPHKKNPILSERLTGLARILRANIIPSLEDVSLWYERDISHSSVERIIIPDSFITAHYMLRIAKRILSGLRINSDKIVKNIEDTRYTFFSQILLLHLIKKGMQREDAYKKVQEMSFEAMDAKKDFRELVKEDPEMKKIFSPKELEQIFKMENLTKYTDFLYKRVEKE